MAERSKLSLAYVRATVGLTQSELVELVNYIYGTERKSKVVSLNTIKCAENKRGNISPVMAYKVINAINLKLSELKIRKKYTVQDLDWNVSDVLEKKGK